MAYDFDLGWDDNEKEEVISKRVKEEIEVYPDGDPTPKWSIKELKAYAKDNDITVSGSKNDILSQLGIEVKESKPKKEYNPPPSIQSEEIEQKISAKFSSDISEQDKKIEDLENQIKKYDSLEDRLKGYEDLVQNLQEDLKELDFLKTEAEIKNKIIILIAKLNNDNKELEKIYRSIETEAKSRKAFQLSEDRIITMMKEKVKIYDSNGKLLSFPQKRADLLRKGSEYAIDDKTIQNTDSLAVIREFYTNRRSMIKGVISIINKYPELCIEEDTTTNAIDTKTLLAIRQYLSKEIETSEKLNL